MAASLLSLLNRTTLGFALFGIFAGAMAGLFIQNMLAGILGGMLGGIVISLIVRSDPHGEDGDLENKQETDDG